MENVWFIAAIWVGLALIATLLAIWLKLSTALSEIVVGTVAQLVIGTFLGAEWLAGRSEWVTFLAGAGAILLTFLAGAELDPDVLVRKWKEAGIVGLVGFFAPFLGCAMLARFVLHWSWPASWLAGVALSTTSVAVVYAVMLELGLNRTDYGKAILAACFVNDLGTVIALGLIFSPFTSKTLIFAVTCVVVFAALPFVTPWFFRRYGGRVSELEAKFILLAVFAMGGLAVWAGSEAVLPAYLIGMVLAGTVGSDHVLVRRLRTVTFGLLTPFYFIRAGSFVSIPALVKAPWAFVLLFVGKSASKSLGIWPTVHWYRYAGREGMYYTLMMSTGLTFGTISALFGLNHQVIDQAQYSYLVATVIGSAVIPTMIANSFFMPTHLLSEEAPQPQAPSRPGRVGETRT
jgi:glutathione-regulated potassium-efflux system ancillary protein KefC